MNIKIDNATRIAQSLTKIRERVGGEIKPFWPRPIFRGIDEDVKWEELKTGRHPSGWILRKGQPVFVYIRDHTQKQSHEDPTDCNKLHFTFCHTLTHMEKTGRLKSRYRVTNRDDNQYYVDVADGWNKSKEILLSLYPCRNCLKKSGYRCFRYASRKGKIKIIKTFDAKEVMDFIKQHLDSSGFIEKISKVRGEMTPSSYISEQDKISRDYRAIKDYTCEKCGVNLSHIKHLTETHHKDRDKRNNSYDNLQCLCKLCHASEHSHYRVDPADRGIIERERARKSFL